MTIATYGNQPLRRGLEAGTALALSLAFGVLFLAASVPGCALWLTWRHTPTEDMAPH